MRVSLQSEVKLDFVKNAAFDKKMKVGQKKAVLVLPGFTYLFIHTRSKIDAVRGE